MRWVRGIGGLWLAALLAACSGRSIRHDTGGQGAGGSSTGATAGTGAASSGGTSGTSGESSLCDGASVSLDEFACNSPFAWVFLGTSCSFVEICRCVDGCGVGYASMEECERAHLGCIRGCGPEDAQWVGDCDEPAHWVFTGANGLCVAMSGCECVGSDCDIRPPPSTPEDPGGAPAIPNPCTTSYLNCLDVTRSCDEIQAAYADYVSRTACALDSDCQVVSGHCDIGLGVCSTVMNAKWPAAGLGALADEWTRAGCAQATFCECPPAPAEIACREGSCVGVR